jgi:hypothetical protein
MSSTRKTLRYFGMIFSSPEADAAVAVVVAGAEAVEAVEVAAAVEAVQAAVVVAGVEAAAGVEAFGSTVAAWRVRDVQWAGGAFRRRHLRISIRRRR